MTPDFIRHFLLWSLVINYGMLLIWFFAFVFARDTIRRLHSRWFALSDATFDAIHYGGMALYKISILLFNLVPFIALCLLPAGS